MWEDHLTAERQCACARLILFLCDILFAETRIVVSQWHQPLRNHQTPSLQPDPEPSSYSLIHVELKTVCFETKENPFIIWRLVNFISSRGIDMYRNKRCIQSILCLRPATASLVPSSAWFPNALRIPFWSLFSCLAVAFCN
jgi:hypothetical protein